MTKQSSILSMMRRKRIARNGQDKIIKMFTYDNQISKMMEILRKEIS